MLINSNVSDNPVLTALTAESMAALFAFVNCVEHYVSAETREPA